MPFSLGFKQGRSQQILSDMAIVIQFTMIMLVNDSAVLIINQLSYTYNFSVLFSHLS